MKPTSLFLLLFFLLSSCTPAATVVPTQTAIPTSTLTPVPSPTITPTPAPENLADASDLPTWIEQYVNAYGGKVTVNGSEMDASQLTSAIKANPDSFTQTKQINGIEYSFLVVNGIPLALMGINGKWDEATLKNISNLTDVSFGIGGIVGRCEPPREWRQHLTKDNRHMIAYRIRLPTKGKSNCLMSLPQEWTLSSMVRV